MKTYEYNVNTIPEFPPEEEEIVEKSLDDRLIDVENTVSDEDKDFVRHLRTCIARSVPERIRDVSEYDDKDKEFLEELKKRIDKK